MFIAHLPSGYLLSRTHPALKQVTGWVMLGSILPDVDMLYFYLIDAGTVHHHTYLTHRPAVWLGVLILSSVLAMARLRALAAGGLLHMLLDCVTGAISWGWPIWDHATPLITVPATQTWWVMSFLLHWSFATEILICAVCLFFYQRAAAQRPALRGKTHNS